MREIKEKIIEFKVRVEIIKPQRQNAFVGKIEIPLKEIIPKILPELREEMNAWFDKQRRADATKIATCFFLDYLEEKYDK